MRYLLFHIWSLAITATLLWLFTSSATNSEGVLVFLSYVVAYTGVLWYQYTKIFTGPHALKPLLVGVFIGFPLGFILRSQFPDFIYADIIALGVATWTVAVLSLWAAKILGPPERLSTSRSTDKTYRAYSSLGPDQAWSQPELQGLLEQLTELPENQLLLIDPGSEFGHEVQQVLTEYSHAKLSELAERAFPEAAVLVRSSKAHFLERMITIEVVALRQFSKYNAMRAVSSINDAKIRVIFGCDIAGITQNEAMVQDFVQDIAELLIQVSAEYHLKYTARDAFLVQSLWSDHESWTNQTAGPSLLERQLKIFSKTGDPNDLLEHLKKELLQDLCLGFDCDLKWDKLPGDFRETLIQRCLGNGASFSEAQVSFLKDNHGDIPDHKLKLHLARCDYSVYSTTVAIRRARSWISGSQSLKPSQSLRPRPSVRAVKKIVNILEKPYSPPKLTFYDIFLKYSGMLYHSAGTLCKFFAIAFVADPEFQREMKCTFRDVYFANRILGGLFLLIWKWSQAIQQALLPTFLVSRGDNHIQHVPISLT
ncbi:hypothetical protein PVAG01_03972 [Phlyctema vagabunda]|uniref:Uncharacterized protein n=1 Tax=Phlyctema vagabunda TaxID=108571 RepID=A0ABR4PMY1_9HELO